MIFLLLLFALLAGLIIGGEIWLEKNLSDLINKGENRDYHISYESADLHFALKGISLKRVQIRPLREETGVVINGNVAFAQLLDVKWKELFLNRTVDIGTLEFQDPQFVISISQDTAKKEKKETGRSIQNLFGDILSSGGIESFRLTGGSIEVFRDQLKVAHSRGINFEANGIETDSIQWKYPIPFKVSSFSSAIGGATYTINPELTLSTGAMSYSSMDSRLSIHDIALKYNKPPEEINRILGKQVDIMEVEVRELTLKGMEANSSLYGDIDIRANHLLLEGIDLSDHRDKNYERPPDREKPMFEKMVELIPIGLDLDTIQIRNSRISYAEVPFGKEEPGVITFEDFYGSIYNITTHKETQEKIKRFEADIQAQLNGLATMKARLSVPYGREAFWVEGRMDTLDVTKLNKTIVAMTGIELKSGTINNVVMTMNATRTGSLNTMEMDFTDLEVAILKEADHDKAKRRGVLSNLANYAIRNSNHRGDKDFYIASYESERNIYRGPFNFMWVAFKDGMMDILPSKTVKGLMGGNKKDKEKKHRQRVEHKELKQSTKKSKKQSS